jgi:hypothetical protein
MGPSESTGWGSRILVEYIHGLSNQKQWSENINSNI